MIRNAKEKRMLEMIQRFVHAYVYLTFNYNILSSANNYMSGVTSDGNVLGDML